MDRNSGRFAADEYLTWKKSTPYLYDLLLSHVLDWPSLTFQWMYTNDTPRILLGTQTGGAEPSSLLVADVNFPTEDDPGTTEARIAIVTEIPHDGEVNRARHMGNDTTLIATKGTTPAVCVYDLAHQAKGKKRHRPTATLQGHTKGGYGLAWNPKRQHTLASGSDDHRICVWDISREKAPTVTLKGHSNVVEDVCWSAHKEWLLASASDDKKLGLWDIRAKNDCITMLEVAQRELNCVDFNPMSEWLLATGSADGKVMLWDHRKLQNKLHSFKGHADQVYGLHFAPFNGTVLCSSSADGKLHVNDLALIGSSQAAVDQTTPPELIFIHNGHFGKVSDFGWNPNSGSEWVIGSVSEDNLLHVWKMSSYLSTPLQGAVSPRLTTTADTPPKQNDA